MFGNDIITHTTDTFNVHIAPRTLYILIHNNHCYTLYCDIRSFQQLVTDLKEVEKKLQVGSKFPLPKKETKSYKTIFIDELDDVVSHILLNKEDHIKIYL